MKKLIRFFAVLLALTLLAGCVMAELVSENADPVLYTISGTEVHQSEVDAMLQDMVYNSYTDSLADYDTAIEYMVRLKLINDKIVEMGLNQFTVEEEEAFRNEAQIEWDAAIDEYVSYFLTEDTDEARAQARKDAEAYYDSYGYSMDVIIENLKWTDSYEKLQSSLVEATDEEIQVAYDEVIAEYKNTFDNDIETYEYYKEYYGYEMLYTPAGYRGIIHILLEVDEELMNAYTAAQAALEEDAEGLEETESVTQADVDATREAILNSRQKEIDEIYARLQAGESFETLVVEYGTDPGMENEENLKNGYAVHRESLMDPAFIQCAFSDKMQNPGDVSDPVVGIYGIHILYYLRDIPSGAVEMTEELRDQFRNEVISEKFFEELEKWETDAVVYNQEAIDAAKTAAIAAEQVALETEENELEE